MYKTSVFLSGIMGVVLFTVFVIFTLLHMISVGAQLGTGLSGGALLTWYIVGYWNGKDSPNQPEAIAIMPAINSDIERAEPRQSAENDLRHDESLSVDSFARSLAEIIVSRSAINLEIEQAALRQRIENDLRQVESQSAASFPRSMAVAPASASPFWKQNEANIQLSLTLHSRYVVSESKTPIPDRFTCAIAQTGELMEDPYLAGKHNFDKTSLDGLFEGGQKQTAQNPISREPIRYQDIKANDPLRREILEFVEECEKQKRLLDKAKAEAAAERAASLEPNAAPNERTPLLTR
jgi:hypothetical protein